VSAANRFRLPALTPRFVPIWRRHFLVWRRFWAQNLVGNIADPLIYLVGFGYGIGAIVPQVGNVPYINFIAAGSVCIATTYAASFEVMYSAFSRMHVQRTWDAILAAPLTLDDIVLAELVWAASKAVLSGLPILLVAGLLGLWESPLALWIALLIPLVGLTFAALGLPFTALAHGYEFFVYYFTLLITPMAILCGVFFPVEQLPPTLRMISEFLPLTHATALARPLLLGSVPPAIAYHAAVLIAYTLAGFYLAVILFRRRLQS